MVVLVPSWADGVVDWMSCSELDEGESGPLELLRLPGSTFRRNLRDNGGGGVFTQSKTDPGLVVLWSGQRVVGRLNVLDTVGPILLWFAAGRIRRVFSSPEGTAPDEFFVLLHFVVKGVQSIEGDWWVLGEVFALGLAGKSVGYINLWLWAGCTHLLVRLRQESHVLKCVSGHVPSNRSEHDR